MNIIEDVRQQLNPVNLHEENLVSLPLINLFVEACHVIFPCKLTRTVCLTNEGVAFNFLCFSTPWTTRLTTVRLEYKSTSV